MVTLDVPALWDAFSAHLSALSACLAIGSGLLLLWLRKHFTPRTETTGLSTRVNAELAALSDRITVVESDQADMRAQMDAMPTRQEVEHLRLDMRDMRGDLRALGTKMDGLVMLIQAVQSDSTLVKEHLMDRP